MTKTILILNTPDDASTNHIINLLQDLLKNEEDISLAEEGNTIYFSTITDRNNSLDREEGSTFPGQAHFNYEDMLRNTMNEVVDYIGNKNPKLLQIPKVQKWIKMIQENPKEAQKFFNEEELFDVVDFHWDTETIQIN